VTRLFARFVAPATTVILTSSCFARWANKHCNVSVHQSCYGMSNIPEGDWICDLCIKFGVKGKYVRCPLCDCRGGILRRSKIKSINSFFLRHNKDYYNFSSSRQKESRANIEAEATICAIKPITTMNEFQKTPPTIFSIIRPTSVNVRFQQKTPESVYCENLENKIAEETHQSPTSPIPHENKIINEASLTPESCLRHSSLSQPSDKSHFSKHYLESNKFKSLSQYMLTHKLPLPTSNPVMAPPNSDLNDNRERNTATLSFRWSDSKPKRSNDLKPSFYQKYDELNLLYDFYRETFKFTKEELSKNEPLPENCWIHASCAFWIPELYCSENFDNLDIAAISQIDKKRFAISCVICNSTRGAVVSCNGPSCEEWFHVECARRAKLHFEIQQGAECKFLAFCPKHTTLPCKKKLDSQDQKFRDEIMKLHKYLKRILKNNRLLSDDQQKRSLVHGIAATENQQDDKSLSSKAFLRKQSSNTKKQTVPIRPPIEHMVKHLSYEHKHFLRSLRDEIEFDPNYSFHVNLTVDKNRSYKVKSITKPPNIFANALQRDDTLWRLLADSMQNTAKSVHKRYQSLLEHLNSLADTHQPQTSVILSSQLNDSVSSPAMSPRRRPCNRDNLNSTIAWNPHSHLNCLFVEPITNGSENHQVTISCWNCGKYFHKYCVENWIGELSIEFNNTDICLGCRGQSPSMLKDFVNRRQHQNSFSKNSSRNNNVRHDDLDMESCIRRFLTDNDCFQIDCFLRSTQPQLFFEKEINNQKENAEIGADSQMSLPLVIDVSSANNPVKDVANFQNESLEPNNAENFRDKSAESFIAEERNFLEAQSPMLFEEEGPRMTS
jgi:hypothetical protein